MTYFFAGIKGSGMTGLACILHDMGNEVLGCDDAKVYSFTEEPLNERGIKAFVISGTVKGTTEALIGFTTLRMIDEFNFTKCFVGANGIDVVGGFSTPQMNEGEIKRKVIQRTITPYVVADSSKFNLRSAISFAKLTDATLITDKKVKDFDYSQLKVIASED